MIINNSKAKRIGIFFFYDKDGIVDDYIKYLLDSFRPHFNYVLCVVNGTLSVEGYQILRSCTDEIYIRENKGFDSWAYKTGIEHIGWEKLYTYDELIMFNFTIMGPVNSFDEMFIEMDKRDLDFWGITMHHRIDFDPFGSCKYGYIPDHIQSHYIAIRNSMLKSPEFRKYWINLPEINDYNEAVAKHEAIFTHDFSQKGFKYDTYVNTDDLKTENAYPLMYLPKELVENRKCPIFKRRMFFHDYYDILNNSNGSTAHQFLDYLSNNNKFDTNLIWQNLLRTQHQEDIVRNLNLNYICSTNICSSKIKSKCAMVCHLYYSDMSGEMIKYASFMPDNADIYFTVVKQDTMDALEEKLCTTPDLKKRAHIRFIENRGRDVSSLLVGVKDVVYKYDLVCFIHDKKSPHINPGTLGRGFAETCYDNICYSKEYISGIINLFENNNKLGIAVPPYPSHGIFFGGIGNEWGPNYDCTLELYNKLGLTVPISKYKKMVAPYGTCFWFRPAALKKLYDQNWKYEDFPEEPNKNDGTLLHAVERLYPLVAQNSGYYPAIIMSDTYASVGYTNYEFYIREYNKRIFSQRFDNSFYACINRINLYEITDNMTIEHTYDSLGEDQRWYIVKKMLTRKIPKKIWNCAISVICVRNKWLKDTLKI